MGLLATVFSGISVFGVPELDTRQKLIGAWEHRGFYYVIQDSTLTAIQLTGQPKGYRSFNYSLREMGTVHTLRYGRDLKSTVDNELLVVADVTDSTAVIAYPTVFVREDSSKGFIGEWRHVEDLAALTLTVGAGSIEYSELRIDMVTGAEQTVTQKRGFYRGNYGPRTGQFTVHYDDGSKARLLPLIFGKIMYLYDLSPRKSMFMRRNDFPSFRDFQKISENGG